MSQVFSDYIQTGVEPFPDSTYGPGYRCSVYLTDGTFLPCVVLRKGEPVTKLALRRFKEEKKGLGIFRSDDSYERVVTTFVTSGNRVNAYDIRSIQQSKYALPLELLRKIRGETTMAWTGFVFEMNDGKYVSFGTTFGVEFFDLPGDCAFSDVVAVHNHSYVSESGELKALQEGFRENPSDYDRANVYRERPYFVCYYDV